MMRFLPWLMGLCATAVSAFWPTDTAGPLFPEPTVEGDTAVFNRLQHAWARQTGDWAPEKGYLHTDRTLYAPGDTLWFGAYLVNAGDLLPSTNSHIAYVGLYDPRGTLLQELCLAMPQGRSAGEFNLSPTLPGGRYRLRLHTNWMCNDSSSFFYRDIVLQKTVAPRINLKLEFDRKAVGPGDEVTARFDAFSLENQPVANQPLQFSVALAGKPFTQGKATTDGNGRAWVKFKLPSNLDTPDGLLDVRIGHQGREEGISRAIPIVLNKIDLQFFPEGGEALAGHPCRIAFKAINEFGKAADVEGYVANNRGERIAAFSSFHNGMGAFDLPPLPAGQSGTAHLTKPIQAQYPLPTIAAQGANLQLTAKTSQHLEFYVGTPKPGTYFLTGVTRDKFLFFKEITLQNNRQTVRVPIGDWPIGIARFTLLDAQQREMAERLVFLHRDRGLRIEVTPNQTSYQPREPVRLRLRVQDRKGQPVQGHFSVSVTDESLLTYADDKQGHLLASLLLEQDLKGDVEEPNFYFDPSEPKSETALDYLLLTQGWRRFRWKEALRPTLPLVPAFKAETNDLCGVLVRFEDYKPISGRPITLLPDQINCTTDPAGRFVFKNVDWTQPKYLRDATGVTRAVPYTHEIMCVVEGKSIAPETYYTGPHILTGTVRDQSEALIGATVKVMQKGIFVRGTITDVLGNYRIALPAAEYTVEVSYTGYSPSKCPNVKVLPNRINQFDCTLESAAMLDEVVITQYKAPLIKQDDISSGQTITFGSAPNMAARRKSPAAKTAGMPVVKVAEESEIIENSKENIDGVKINIKGSRSNATNYYIDGIRVAAPPSPVEDIELGGLPADLAGQEDDEPPMVFEEVAALAWGESPQADKPAAKSKEVWRQNSQPLLGVSPHVKPNFHRAREFYVPKYRRQDPMPTERTDFRPTIYWNAFVKTDAFGEANVDFVASDAIANFRVTVEGISPEGQPGRVEHKIFTEKPFSIEAKVPPFVVVGDTLRLDVLVVNKTKRPLSGKLSATVPPHFTLLGTENEGQTLVYSIGVPQSPAPPTAVALRWVDGTTVLDQFKCSVTTWERGFPAKVVLSGNAAQQRFPLQLMQPVAGTVTAMLTAYPNALQEVLKSAERMLQQPGGCFEQVSSSNYPNLLVLDLLRRTNRSEPALEKKALGFLESGYKQLTGYECKNGGFDWWGREPAHEGLTAYGLLEFTDMSRVFPVDQALLDRTAAWLRSRRDGKGGWTINPQSLHGWQNDGVLGAYLAWAVAESGYGRDFALEIDQAAQAAWDSGDPYQLALLANALHAKKDARAGKFTARLLESQQENGGWKGKTHSVLHAYGLCFDIETTALAALALLHMPQHAASVHKAMSFILQSKTEYGYGSTQSTVMALRALCAYSEATGGRNNMGNGTLVVQIDGKRVSETPISPDLAQTIKIPQLERFFVNDHPQIEVFFEKTKSPLAFDIEVQYSSRQPRNTGTGSLALNTVLAQETVQKGETLRLSATLENKSNQPAASPMLIVGIPAGLSLQPWQLKKLMDEKRCDFYELWDNQAVFHFEHLPAHTKRTLDLDLRADVAGSFESPASQAFLYYQNDERVWSKPSRVTVLGE